MYSEKNNRINSVVESALKNINKLIDVNTAIGKPIITENGDYIFPISKVILGTLSCGGEYGKVNIFKNSSDLPFTAGNGSVISLKPCAFLIKKSNGECNVINIDDTPQEKLLEKATAFLSNLTGENRVED